MCAPVKSVGKFHTSRSRPIGPQRTHSICPSLGSACGAIIIDGLKAAAGDLKVVGDVRGKGLMFAVDLADPATGKPAPALAAKAMEETRQRGLLIGKGGLYGHALRMAPPMNLTDAEAKEGLGLLIDALRAVDAGAAR